MYRFWDTIIKPVLDIMHPGSILEIGSDKGLNTQNLLEFCQKNSAKLHVIDPLPKYDASEWEKKFNDHLVFHLSLSLNTLSQIDQFDVVLIDGDHNWYTVINELKLIEKRSLELGFPFPLIMLHDIGWPYGRRDLYYNPDNIPEAFRKPYKQMGIKHGSAELVEKEGLNPHLYNANYENDPQNGVLSAVEDFLKVTENNIELVKIQGIYGLGILIPKLLMEQNRDLKNFIKSLKLSPFAKRYIEHIESDRIEELILRQEQSAAVQKLKTDMVSMEQQISEASALIDHYNEVLKQKYQDLPKANSMLNQKDQDLSKPNNKWMETERLINKRFQDIDTLIDWIEQLNVGITTILNSQRWKVGKVIGDIYRKMLFKPRVPTPMEYINKVLKSFSAWHKVHNSAKNQRDGLESSVNNMSFSDVAQNSKKPFNYSSVSTKKLTLDIIVCVHNALPDVKNCLDSILRKTNRQFNLYIVNDCSDETTTEYLRHFSTNHKFCILLENPVAEGYTKAANKGLRASTADYIILLNSDTVVTNDCFDKIIECGESDPKIGIIGPLSNAASWQSVPKRFDPDGDWSVNMLPEDYSFDDMAQAVASVSDKSFPRVSFINGFCYAIKRSLVNVIGYLDEEAFPKGFGEENDYSLRAADAGFELAVADHVYVYHAKSKSYSHKRRKELSLEGGEALRRKHGKQLISRGVKSLRYEPALEKIRERLSMKVKMERSSPDAFSQSSFNVLFLLPVRGGGGGAHSVVQEAVGMRKLGIYAQVAVKCGNMPDFHRNYPSLSAEGDLFYFFDNVNDLVLNASRFNVAIATVFHSIKLLKNIVEAHPSVMPAYYIQDYEPWFFEQGSKDWKCAFDSYTLIPEMVLFAKTQWICETIKEKHNVKIEQVNPSLDQAVYFPTFVLSNGLWPLHLVAMIRPSTPRRGPDRTMRIFKKLKLEFGHRVSIDIFGCDNEDPEFQQLELDFEFTNHGSLIREDVAQLLRRSNIFIDLSDYQAFGRTGLEAMACGCAVVLPAEGGVHEYAVDKENALLVNTKSEDACLAAIVDLVSDSQLREKLQRNAVQKATEYSIRKAAVSELMVFKKRWHERHERKKAETSFATSLSIRNKVGILKKIRVAGILPRTSSNEFPGSSYIRIILPLEHPSLKGQLEFTAITEDDLFNRDVEILVVQRTAVPDEQKAYKLLSYCQRRRIYTIYETDDELHEITNAHPEAAKYKKAMKGVKIFAMNADMVTVSSEKLKESIRTLNPNVHVIPNALDEQIWCNSTNPSERNDIFRKDKIRILYMGSRTHHNDLLIVEKALKKILAEYGDRVVLDIAGIIPNGNEQSWFNTITIPSSASSYPNFVKWLHRYSRWDIGIAPLENTEFNNCKSYIKFLDYSALGLASICSNINPYMDIVENGVNGILVDNTRTSWYEAIKRLIDDEDFRTKLSRNAYECFAKNHTLETQSKAWLTAYSNLIKK